MPIESSNPARMIRPPDCLSTRLLDASYRYDGVTQRLLYIDGEKAAPALLAGLEGAFTPDIKFVTVNASQYGGGGGAYSVYAGGNSRATEIALLELGHSFAGLADEYAGAAPRYMPMAS